jgi:hypothetical protein
MLAHAGGADESLSIVLIFAAMWVGWIGWSRLRGRGFARLGTAGAAGLLALAGAFAVASATLPHAIFPGPGEGPRPASTATLAFEAPADGVTGSGDRLSVLLDLQGGRVTQTTSTTLDPAVGHLHLSVDGRLVSMTSARSAVVDLGGLAPGAHTLEAEFVAADHGPFAPRVIARVSFTKAGSA